jgi:hypothetical protein
MNDRYMETDPEARALLDDLVRAAQGERPGPQSMQRTVVALGLGAATLTAATTATATGAAAAAGKSAGMGLSLLSIVKAAAVGVVAGGIALGTAASTGLLSPAPQAPSAVVSPAVAAQEQQRAIDPASKSGAPAAAGTEQDDDLQAGDNAPSAPGARQQPGGLRRPALAPQLDDPVSTEGRAEAPASEATLADEVRMLEAARSEISRRRAGAAIEILDRYRRDFPDGRLALEAEVLRIESLFRSGKATAAVGLADTFLAANPKSPLASRVRTMVRDAQGAAGGR